MQQHFRLLHVNGARIENAVENGLERKTNARKQPGSAAPSR